MMNINELITMAVNHQNICYVMMIYDEVAAMHSFFIDVMNNINVMLLNKIQPCTFKTSKCEFTPLVCVF